ncbi:MAG TPA: hypothetical protein VFW69_14135 [Mycobacterium sp.]|nr:hypothetical protein [Mycobacterium sp.]
MLTASTRASFNDGSQLARANRITQVHQGALGELDAAFSTDRTPFCGTVL